MDVACFACHPAPGAGHEPRALCLRHKQECELPDGVPLHEALARVRPTDGALEGSSLGWLYNPVFVVDDRGNRCRGWASFAGGGMAVLEDRFGATDPFEFWMYARDDMGALLTAVGEMGDVVEPRTVLENLTRPSREAFALALRMWCWYRDIADRCRVLGRWPVSFEELTALLAEPDPDDPMQPAEIRRFLEQLARLAIKRRYEPDCPRLTSA